LYASHQSPWAVLGVDIDSTEKQVRQAYATKLKQLDLAVDGEAFEALRFAYEQALLVAKRQARNSSTLAEYRNVGEPSAGDAMAPLPATGAVASHVTRAQAVFSAMNQLVVQRNYSVSEWRSVLNSPLLDPPEVSAYFEFALIDALCENELKSTYTLSAGPDWLRLIEDRYAWIADGLRFSRLFPNHSDLRDALVDLARPRPVRAIEMPESTRKWRVHPFVILLVVTVLGNLAREFLAGR